MMLLYDMRANFMRIAFQWKLSVVYVMRISINVKIPKREAVVCFYCT